MGNFNLFLVPAPFHVNMLAFTPHEGLCHISMPTLRVFLVRDLFLTLLHAEYGIRPVWGCSCIFTYYFTCQK